MPKPVLDPDRLRAQAARLLGLAEQAPNADYAELFRALAAELLQTAADIDALSRLPDKTLD